MTSRKAGGDSAEAASDNWLARILNAGNRFGMPMIFSFALLWVGYTFIIDHRDFLRSTIETNVNIAEAVRALAKSHDAHTLLLQEISANQRMQMNEVRDTTSVLHDIRSELRDKEGNGN